MEEPATTFQNEKGIELLPEGIKSLDEARKWTMFLSVMGFIGVGFLLLAAIFMALLFRFLPSEDLPSGFGTIFSLLYFVIAIVYFFPIFYLLQFSMKAKAAITDSSSKSLTEAIERLKSHYKFFGITTIVVIVLYPVIIIAAVIFGVFSSI